MLDIGWSELILIGVVALIVIGPKDLPDMFRQLGRFTAKLRSMARDFSRAMEQAASESGVKDVAKDLRAITTPQSLGLNAMKDAAAKFEKWDPLKNAATPTKAPLPAAAATPTTAATNTIGPQTQALLDKQAARQAIVAESTERLRAVNAGGPASPVIPASPVMPAPADPPATPKPRAKAAKRSAAADSTSAGEPAPKSATKRKAKKADEA